MHKFVMGGMALLVALIAMISLLLLLVRGKGTTQNDRIITQISSGRWILTVMAGVAFLMFSVAIAAIMFAQRSNFEVALVVAVFGQIMLVIQGVYKDYFQSSRDNDENGNGNENGNGHGNGGSGPQGAVK